MILQSKEQEFRSLFSEFVKDNLRTTDGEKVGKSDSEGKLSPECAATKRMRRNRTIDSTPMSEHLPPT